MKLIKNTNAMIALAALTLALSAMACGSSQKKADEAAAPQGPAPAAQQAPVDLGASSSGRGI